jgi:hypothetical protein
LSSGADLLNAVKDRFNDDPKRVVELCFFLENYMKSDAGIVSSATDILRHVQKRWGHEPYMFLLGYLGGGDFPKMERPKKGTPDRDEHGRWITPS